MMLRPIIFPDSIRHVNLEDDEVFGFDGLTITKRERVSCDWDEIDVSPNVNNGEPAALL